MAIADVMTAVNPRAIMKAVRCSGCGICILPEDAVPRRPDHEGTRDCASLCSFCSKLIAIWELLKKGQFVLSEKNEELLRTIFEVIEHMQI